MNLSQLELSPETLLKVFSVNVAFLTIRYIIIAGLAYYIFWKLLKDKFQSFRIQDKFPDREKIFTEIKYSMSTFLIFSIVGVGVFTLRKAGYTKIYSSISDYGWGYAVFSFILLVLVHDTYFYWAHRLMHHKLLFKRVHQVHHYSTNPSPWASFSFHPYEAVLETAFIPAFVIAVPTHPGVMLTFLIAMTVMNVLGHLGYEFWAKGFTRNPWTGWNNTSTHHNMHHQKFNCNYSLYFNWWDKICGTNHEEYHNEYDRVTAKRKTGPQIQEHTEKSSVTVSHA